MDFKSIIEDSASIKLEMINCCLEEISKASVLMYKAITEGKKIIWCGNGGSAADAQHMAAELMGGLRDHSRPPIHSIALTTDTSFITAWANDTDYDTIFSRQLEAMGKKNDVLIAISTSGNSRNVLQAIEIAKSHSMFVIILTGKLGGKMGNLGDIVINAPSNDTQRIQECHLLIEHMLCEYVEYQTLKNL